MMPGLGTVYLIGAGPGDPDLITVRGLRWLQRADVVLYDRLAGEALLAEARPDAELIDVGKAPGRHRYAQEWINALLIDRAKGGRLVVRLKGGDPFVFGRGFEELTACRDAGVPCIVVPGITSAIAAPSAAGIPVTVRGSARSVAIVTGHVADDMPAADLDFAALAAMDTVVVLMGRRNLNTLSASLIAAGRDRNTPAACIERATTPDQRVVRATLGTIADAADRAGLASPLVTVIGDVAAHADAHQAWPVPTWDVEASMVPRAG